MTDRPIIFSAPMVRALLDGRKTMTRRLAWRRAKVTKARAEKLGHTILYGTHAIIYLPTVWQKVRPGDRLWVLEKHWCVEIADGGVGAPYLIFDEEWSSGHGAREPMPAEERPWLGPPYFDDENQEIRWGARPSIYMPRWASRLTLVVTETKLERLQEISHADMRAEGLQAWESTRPAERCMNPRRSFGNLWNTLHKPGDLWEDNPEVVAIAGTVHKVNIDRMEQAA